MIQMQLEYCLEPFHETKHTQWLLYQLHRISIDVNLISVLTLASRLLYWNYPNTLRKTNYSGYSLSDITELLSSFTPAKLFFLKTHQSFLFLIQYRASLEDPLWICAEPLWCFLEAFQKVHHYHLLQWNRICYHLTIVL